MTATTGRTHLLNVEEAVLDRYRQGAEAVQPALCCPTSYDADVLQVIPQEILEKDYGCGDPSKYARSGDTVIDLGSGAGKICYILSQKVGRDGRVIGVDFNDTMLALAHKYKGEIAEKVGYDNVEFRKGRIQDLALSLDAVQQWLAENPVQTVDDALALEAAYERFRQEQPLVADETADLVVSNCVLNLVRTDQKAKLFGEIHRVLKLGGRAVISDIVCDEEPTEAMKNDPELWSGCISGAFREDEFLQRFEDAGFFGVEVLERGEQPWQTIDGIEFRSMTVRAFKGKEGPCHERNQAVIYRGPWKQVRDDDGHTLYRGQRMAVCDKTYRIMTNPNGPYAKHMIGVEPLNEVPLDEAELFNCKAAAVRHPKQTKGVDYDATIEGEGSCTSDGACC